MQPRTAQLQRGANPVRVAAVRSHQPTRRGPLRVAAYLADTKASPAPPTPKAPNQLEVCRSQAELEPMPLPGWRLGCGTKSCPLSSPSPDASARSPVLRPPPCPQALKQMSTVRRPLLQLHQPQ